MRFKTENTERGQECVRGTLQQRNGSGNKKEIKLNILQEPLYSGLLFKAEARVQTWVSSYMYQTSSTGQVFLRHFCLPLSIIIYPYSTSIHLLSEGWTMDLYSENLILAYVCTGEKPCPMSHC